MQYVIRKDPGISFEKSELTVEWPDDAAGVYLNNPNRVSVSYQCDDNAVAYVDKTGWITTVRKARLPFAPSLQVMTLIIRLRLPTDFM